MQRLSCRTYRRRERGWIARRRRCARGLRGLVLLGCSLTSAAFAESLPFEATFSIRGLGVTEPIATATGTALVNGAGPAGHLSSIALPSGLLSVMTTITPTPNAPSSPPFSLAIVTLSNASGSFSRATAGAALAGEMAIPGNVRACRYVGCQTFVDIPLTSGPETRGVGLSGSPIVRSGPVMVTVDGAPWTTGSVRVSTPLGTLRGSGSAHGPASATASTARPGGVVQLVTPVAIITKRRFSSPSYLPALGILEIRFLPEPRRLALHLPGVAALLALGVSRRRGGN